MTTTPDTLAALVGAGITYAGDMANESGAGAIVAARPCNFYRAALDVILTDGRAWTLHPHDLDELQAMQAGNVRRFGRSRFSMTGEHFSADQLAELRAAAAVLTAQRAAAKTMADRAHTDELARLAAEYPHLQRGAAAPNIRRMLKAAWPRVKFSVRSDHSSIRITWTDGPTAAQVEAVADRFELGHFDGMTDCYNYARSAWCELFGGVEYVFTTRQASDALVSAAIELVAAEYGAQDKPTAADYRSGAADRVSPIKGGAYSNQWSWQSLIYQAHVQLAGAGVA